MPELPEVETVRAGLAPHMEGRGFAKVDQRRPDLRFPFPEKFVERLEGATIDAVGRRAKYLVLDLSTGECLIMHLGMSGSFRIEVAGEEKTPGEFHHERTKASAHDHVVFELNDGGRVIYNDPRRFGFMDLVPRAELENCKHFAKMGIEPLGNELSGDYIAERFDNRKTPLKAALLDQRHVAGLGNIYVCEALWRCGLSPTRAAGTLVNKSGKPSKKATELAGHIREVLGDAIAAGGSSLRDYSHTDGSLGYFQHSFAVYDRENEPCAKQSCNGIVERIVQSGRSTFYCPKCQK